jgi:hypothetical protein
MRSIAAAFAFFAGIAGPLATHAEEWDEFSRANCFNNESITYDFFYGYLEGAVISWHYDSEADGEVHYVGHAPPVSCWGQSTIPCPTTCYPNTSCLWPIVRSDRLAAIHNVADGVPLPGLSTRWHTRGYHNHWFGWVYGVPIYFVTETDASDCNLHFDQFY